MFYKLKNDLASKVAKEVERIFGYSHEINVQYPTQLEFGDFSLTFPFEMARILRQPPAKTADKFVENFHPPEYIDRIEIAGRGYINLFLKKGFIMKGVISAYFDSSLFSPFSVGREKIIVEHTNINPNKAAHVGHLRNAVLGDTLVRLMRYLGKRVEVQNYIDNTGVQVADVVVGFLYLDKKKLDEVMRLPGRFDHYCWDLYARVGDFYDASEENKKLRYDVLKKIEEGTGDVAEIAHYVATKIVNNHLDTMERLGIEYDVLPRESDILHLKFWNRAFEMLKATGALQFEDRGENKGCWVMKYERDGSEDTKIIVRSNGTVTYTGKDIAYQLWKVGKLGIDFFYEPFRTYHDGHTAWITRSTPPSGEGNLVEPPPEFGGGEWIYNVIDVRQSYTQNVVIEALRKMGFKKESEKSIHFSYEMVALSQRCAKEFGFELSKEDITKKHVEVSGRKGIGVKADDLIDVLEEKLYKEVTKRNTDFDPENAKKIARQIAIGALRYFMIKFTRNSLIIFDMDDALSFEGDTGPYLQYSAVRAKNIIEKFKSHYSIDEEVIQKEWSLLSESDFDEIPDDVWELTSDILKFRDMASGAFKCLEISNFARFLYSLSQKFSSFYNKHRIIGEKNRKLQYIFLAVVAIYYEGIKKGLEILGIPIPERM